jgi:hypothetical protein
MLRKPMAGFDGCCARATNGDAAAPPKAPRKSRRRMSAPLGWGEGHSTGSDKRSGSGLDVRFGIIRVDIAVPAPAK